MMMVCHKCGKGIGTMIFRSDQASDTVNNALKRTDPMVTCPECNKLVK
jgi:DNA-directed RNA polymerase subunit RPC12/RpoP